MVPLEEKGDLALYEFSDDFSAVERRLGMSGLPRPFRMILESARASGANRILVESNYIDFAYRAEHISYYGGLFKGYDPDCQRIAFFRSSEESLHPFLSSKQTECIGFTVLRPTRSGRVGRTILPPAPAELCAFAHTCEGFFSLHVWGREFSIRGFPFIQQDTQVMRCAQACLFSCMLFLQRTGGRPLSLPHEISEVATRQFAQLGRPFPSVGLTIEEITNFLYRVGYEPLAFVKQPRDEYGFDPVAWVPYAASGIPSILTTESHALTAHGYVVDLNCAPREAVVHYHSLVTMAIVHDDGRGPYSILPKDEDAEKKIPDAIRSKVVEGEIKTETKPGEPPMRKHRVWSFDDVHSITVPCPRKMHLRASEASKLAESTLNLPLTLAGLAAAATEGNGEAQLMADILGDGYDHSHNHEDSCVIKTWLAKSHKLKELAFKRLEKGGDRQSLIELIEMKLPRLVWVAEVTTLSLLREGKDRILGEILLDATGIASADPVLYVHLPGQLAINSGETGQGFELSAEAPYPGWHEPSCAGPQSGNLLNPLPAASSSSN